MKFWDSSALVPLLFREASSSRMERELAADPEVGVWCLASAEIWSAACRRRREGIVDSPGMRTARARLHDLAGSWLEIDDVPAVRSRALRLLETHDLRAGDALQLAAALVLVSDHPDRLPFVTLDGRLAAAAEQEGFEVRGVTPE